MLNYVGDLPGLGNSVINSPACRAYSSFASTLVVLLFLRTRIVNRKGVSLLYGTAIRVLSGVKVDKNVSFLMVFIKTIKRTDNC